jgi:hypothetical protein
MLEIEYKKAIFRVKSVWFSNYPFNVENCDLVMFSSCKNNVDLVDFYKEDDTTLIIDLTQNLDQIWGDMSQSTRRSINKAKRDGVNIKINENYKDFIQIMKRFRKEKGLKPIRLTADFMKKNATLFVAEFNGEIICGQLYLEDEDNICWYIGASKRLISNAEKAKLIAKANKIMVWEAIKYSKDKGIKEFDFGGYHLGNNNDLFVAEDSTFKKRFGGKIVTRYYYVRNYSEMSKLALKVYIKMNNLIKPYKMNQQFHIVKSK